MSGEMELEAKLSWRLRGNDWPGSCSLAREDIIGVMALISVSDESHGERC